MTILRNSTVFSAATAVLAVVLLSAGASAQERSTAADSATTGGELPGQAQIAAWIEQLDAPEFAERQRAEAGLTTIGSGAVVSLKKALPDSSPERRLRIENLLRRLERNSVAKLTEELARHPDAGAVVRLKQGRRFLELVGTDAAAVGLFARMLKAEPELFTAAEESRPITELLEQRAQAVNQSTRPVPERMDRFSADSFAALLLLCSDDSLRLGSASASVSTVLVQPDFATAINDEAVGGLLKRLVGAYILRERIAVDLPLT
ncbi:MAG: hypothetical protein KDA89_14785, partial [Planctomycetaceae bacterium]|nr:hypothetical protein [Planctomycetaceae bacterium]